MGGFDLSRYLWPDVDERRQPQETTSVAEIIGNGLLISTVGGSLMESVSGKALVIPSTLSVGLDPYLGRCLINSSQTANAVDLGGGIRTADWTAVFVGSFINYAAPGYNSFFKPQGGGWGLKFMNICTGSPVFSMVIPGVAVYLTNAPVVSGAPYAVAFSATNGGTLQVVSRRLDTGEVFVATPISFGSPSTQSGNSYLLSEELAGYGSDGGSKLSIAAVLTRRLSVNEAIALVESPYDLFRTPLDIGWPVSAAGGGTLNAGASGSSQASGTAALTAQVALAAVGISIASGTAGGSATTDIPLAVAGIAVSSGTANPTATVTISAAGLAHAAGQAGLSASVLLAGAGAAAASGNAALTAQLMASALGAAQASGNATLATQIAALATGSATASGSATIATNLNALASGAAIATGSANLTGGAPGALNASGQVQATGSAVLKVSVNLVATGAAVTTGSAAGTASTPGAISADGDAQSSGSANWSVTTAVTAAGFVQAMGVGCLTVEVPLSASGNAVSSGTATLTDAGENPIGSPSISALIDGNYSNVSRVLVKSDGYRDVTAFVKVNDHYSQL